VIEHDVTILKPVPNMEKILATFERKLRPVDEINEEPIKRLPGVTRYVEI
jgi:hypothetical protein